MVISYKNVAFAALTLLLVTAMACKKENNIDYSLLPVVEAYLTPNHAVEVRVSQQKALLDTNAYGVAITGLQLKVSDGTTSKSLVEDKSGHYMLNDPAFVKTTGTYTLEFVYNNLTVTASTSIPSKPSGLAASSDTQVIPAMTFGTTPTDFVPVTLTWTNPASNNHVLAFKYTETIKQVINSRFNRDTTTNVELNVARVATYALDRNTFRYFGHYQVILMHVNSEYVDMLNHSTGGSTSANLTNTPTNVKNGLGIFTAFQADTLSTYLLVKSEL